MRQPTIPLPGRAFAPASSPAANSRWRGTTSRLAEEKQEYVLLRVAHRAGDYTYITASAGPPSYDNTFEAFPAATQFRPPWSHALAHGTGAAYRDCRRAAG